MTTPFDATFWNERYSDPVYAYGENPNSFLVDAVAKNCFGKTVLLPGDGEGRNGVWLALQGFDVTTVDMSHEGCTKTERLAKRFGVSLKIICADLSSWDWPRAKFDTIASIFLHLPSSLRVNVHARMCDAIKDNGYIIIEAFEPGHLPLRAKDSSVGGPADRDMLYSLEELRADFAPLRDTYSTVTTVDLDEGIYHKGKGSVVRAIFHKV